HAQRRFAKRQGVGRKARIEGKGGLLEQLLKQRSPFGPRTEARVRIQMTARARVFAARSPGTRERLGSLERTERIVCAGHHHARKRQRFSGYRGETTEDGRCVRSALDV